MVGSSQMLVFYYCPLLFFGITFNYGIILGCNDIKVEMNSVAIIFYLGAIFWTLGYDTIYGFQDIKDDEIIGVKSTSIKFKKKPKLFLTTCYLILIISLILVGIYMKLNTMFYFFILIPATHLFFYQIHNFNFKDPKNCLRIFKSNNFFGAIVLCNILIGKF